MFIELYSVLAQEGKEKKLALALALEEDLHHS